MKILITGSSGFLGKVLLNHFAGNYSEVFTLNRYDGSYKCDLAITVPDITEKVDLVIHNAGKAHFTPSSKSESEEFNLVNVIGVKNLLKGLEISGKPNMFVFISSVSVYGVESGINLDENTKLEAKDSYGLSKIQAENIIEQWCNKNQVICTILRLPLVVGKNPPGNLGKMIRSISKGYYFNISGGTSRKSMVLATDVAKNVLQAARIGGTYNLTDGFHPSFFDLSNLISAQLKKNYLLNVPYNVGKIFAFFGDFFGKDFPINSIKFKKITSTLTFDDSKARKSFGWNPISVLSEFKINE